MQRSSKIFSTLAPTTEDLTMTQREAFDPFVVDDDESSDNFRRPTVIHEEINPWSSSTWPNSADLLNTSLDPMMFDDSHYEFAATSTSELFGHRVDDSSSDLVPNDALVQENTFAWTVNNPSSSAESAEKGQTIHVAIHEQLSCAYDDVSPTPICQVEGVIHAQSGLERNNSFALVLSDRQNFVERLDAELAVGCDIVNAMVGSTVERNRNDKFLRVTLPQSQQMTPIASYTCHQQLHPIPLLVKSKVHATDSFCRVGVKVRSNPTNKSPLHDLAILLAVPPDIQGETVRMSRQGGVWDAMKRTVTWSVDKLDPGAVLEVQAQFETVPEARDGNESARTQPIRTPKFPILVRCDTENLFSNIELGLDPSDDGSRLIHLDLTKSVRILHRKV